MTLFNAGDFALHSGARSKFLIDCDALTDADLAALAQVAFSKLLPFGTVEGVPRGGLRFASVMRPFSYPTVPGQLRPCLLVDDVWTTGGSMQRFRESLALCRDGAAHGLVIFARSTPPPWVTALFTMAGA